MSRTRKERRNFSQKHENRRKQIAKDVFHIDEERLDNNKTLKTTGIGSDVRDFKKKQDMKRNSSQKRQEDDFNFLESAG